MYHLDESTTLTWNFIKILFPFINVIELIYLSCILIVILLDIVVEIFNQKHEINGIIIGLAVYSIQTILSFYCVIEKSLKCIHFYFWNEIIFFSIYTFNCFVDHEKFTSILTWIDFFRFAIRMILSLIVMKEIRKIHLRRIQTSSCQWFDWKFNFHFTSFWINIHWFICNKSISSVNCHFVDS